jgi:iron complex transport system substrate-binding protein
MNCRRLLILTAVFLVIAAWFKPAAGASTAITITDEVKRNIELSLPVERLVILTTYPSEIIYALGAWDKVVGICNPQNHFLPEIQKTTSVGRSAVDPNLEKIIELNPDLVIAYQWTKTETVKKLERLNIPVVCVGAWTIKQIHLFIGQMGKLFGKKKRAMQLQTFLNQTNQLIQARTQFLGNTEKPTVFLEGTVPYQTTAVGQNSMNTPWGKFMFESPMQLQVDIAGGVNCVGKQPVKAPKMSPEWLVEKNPDIIIKIPFSKIRGTIVSNESLKNARDKLIRRSGWQYLKAVQNNNVYIIHPRLCAGLSQVIGACYYAKWFHPDRFSDLNPTSIHKEMLKKFWGVAIEGAWGFPYPK